MSATRPLSSSARDVVRASPLAPFLQAFECYLEDRRYATSTAAHYLGSLAHLARWMEQEHLTVEQLDEAVFARFLDEHVPQCRCPDPVVRGHEVLRATCGHLLAVLRADGVIGESAAATTPVEEELRRFETHLEQVRGLAASTRRHQLRIVRCLLVERFGTGRIDLAAILPEQLRRFLARQQTSYTKPHSSATLISTLRSYLRFCVTRGEPVQGLMGVLVSPPNWRQAALPKALSDEEVARLVAALGEDGLSARRDAAIVRCALDLGLRRGEIAALSLDDIDWRDGTLTLRRTKGGRADTLPLPPTTGQAIADYLRLERTQTSSRALFVRCIAPQGRPLGPHGVAKAIRQAYARAGLTGHSAHALRHTLASRLLASGGSLKEVADVLRHRSLDTTLIYAKLDERSLIDVALPWPGANA